MSQVTIYLDAKTEARMREAASAAGLSTSRWLARLIQEKTSDQWPSAVREAAGAWTDFPEPEAPMMAVVVCAGSCRLMFDRLKRALSAKCTLMLFRRM